MSPAFAADVARYQTMDDLVLDVAIYGMEMKLARMQSSLAAAKKARKNQKAAAKKDGRNGSVSPLDVK